MTLSKCINGTDKHVEDFKTSLLHIYRYFLGKTITNHPVFYFLAMKLLWQQLMFCLPGNSDAQFKGHLSCQFSIHCHHLQAVSLCTGLYLKLLLCFSGEFFQLICQQEDIDVVLSWYRDFVPSVSSANQIGGTHNYCVAFCISKPL